MPTLAGGCQVKRARIQAGILRPGNPEVHFAFQAPFLRNAFRRGYLFGRCIDAHGKATKRTKFQCDRPWASGKVERSRFSNTSDSVDSLIERRGKPRAISRVVLAVSSEIYGAHESLEPIRRRPSIAPCAASPVLVALPNGQRLSCAPTSFVCPSRTAPAPGACTRIARMPFLIVLTV